jgi:hypothetical protein
LDICDACRSRSIARVGQRTPLLVPSFSSRGFGDVADIHRLAAPYLVDVSLVSAYDLHHGILVEADIYATELVILDSGGYEARLGSDILEPYSDQQIPRSWTATDYDAVLEQLTPLASVVIVNFDLAVPQPLSRFTEVLSSWHTPEASTERPWTRR